MLQLFMIVFGIVALVKGELKLIGNRRLLKPHGRIVGAILLVTGLFGGILTAMVGLIGAIVYGLANTDSSDTIHHI